MHVQGSAHVFFKVVFVGRAVAMNGCNCGCTSCRIFMTTPAVEACDTVTSLPAQGDGRNVAL
jgi:hypothetical protein